MNPRLRRYLDAPLAFLRAFGRGLLTVLKAIGRRIPRPLVEVLKRADKSHITGISSMVAYGLLWSIFPGALLLLVIAANVLDIQGIKETVQETVQQTVKGVFPSITEKTVGDVIVNLKRRSTSMTVFAVITALWGSMLFFGALESGFSRIYRIKGRSWLHQRRLGLTLLMVPLTIVLLEAVISVVQGLLLAHVDDKPLGLSSNEVSTAIRFGVIAGNILILFGFMVTIYWIVPNRRLRWPAVWPGALISAVAVALLSVLFPLYLTKYSRIDAIGTTFAFVIIVLMWFYLISLFITFGGCVNAVRLEAIDRKNGEAEADAETAPAPAGGQ